MPETLRRLGHYVFIGAVTMRPCRGDGLLRTAEAAKLVGVEPVTIRRWRMLGYLVAQGYDERGNPLHSRDAVRTAERLARENGLRTSGIDPRQLRQRRFHGYARNEAA